MTARHLTDILDDVDGLGPAKRDVVLDAYATVEELAAASVDDLTELDGIGKTIARKILHAATVVEDPTEVTSLRHDDRRKNIPTDENAHLVDTTGDGETDTLLYDRDPDLDPQLVWRGKDAEDRTGLSVPVVPVYIQEKIDPQVLVENLRNTAGSDGDEPELTLFDQFDGIDDPIAAIEFYEHDANWSNRMILGDALVAMTSLAEKEDLKGKVQTVYLDPPYGIKFQSNWQVSTRQRTVSDGKDVSRQPEQVRAFRDTWKDGVNTYLSYLRDRLMAAHRLLATSGSIFVQIGDENLHVVRSLLDEVFGPENFVSLITFQKTSSSSSVLLGGVVDYLVWFARDKQQMKYRQLYLPKTLGEPGADQYRRIRLANGDTRPATKTERAGLDPLPDGARAFRLDNLTSPKPDLDFPFEIDGVVYNPGKNYWKTGRVGMQRLHTAGRLISTGDKIHYLRFLDDFGAIPLNNVWTDTIVSGYSVTDSKNYVVQTASRVVERCLLMTSDPGDLVLDPTCGSGTTAFVAEKWGRRWITMDTSRVALALARQRIMGARYPFFVLSDSSEGASAEATLSGHEVPEPDGGWRNDLRRGFVYERALHVMLSTIANCEDVQPGMRPDEIEAAVRRAADSELLYDQPVEKRSTVRVAGPFTVESLSPHRTTSTDLITPGTGGDFVGLVLDNLQRTGVQNGYRDGRLDLAWLDPRAGTWVHAVGGFTDDDGNDLTVAISVGPETGTVGREHVAEAAKEALRDVRADLLLVCAYAFDAGAGEQANTETDTEHTFTADGQRQVGRLRVLNVRVNTDLMMGDELKATGVGNLFTVFGEPDVTITDNADDTYTVTLEGLDIYDPNKGTVRSTQPSEIACWFIDTNYNGDSFFVRHAYFTGGGTDPFDALKKALRSEIDPDAWDALYRTDSLPFPRPGTGKIAVKAINHFGDEAMRVFQIG